VRAAEPTEARDGTLLGAGTNTLDNHFRFTNGIARAGVGLTFPLSETQSLRFEAGGQLRAVRYHLEQQDAIQQASTTSTQSWNEWSRSWGLSVRFAGADVQYRGRLTTGAGRPGFDDGGGIIAVDDRAVPTPGGGFGIGVPQFGLRFADVRAITHQISVSVPIR
jgi:hypothetical protein